MIILLLIPFILILLLMLLSILSLIYTQKVDLYPRYKKSLVRVGNKYFFVSGEQINKRRPKNRFERFLIKLAN